ncbi:DUF4123 domain-containing protein [Halomonas heilongjiangensis]|uniref:DUF4123 domain-containing protein n=1 Tax=Halomonas heilongjiangensis TaxID=1387883 RepID=A0A2N7TL67_9GAMM|nr:DUF4123 domain-containing protein [Halomonas heilongjiangensis]PMR68909.1 hypothetical protein C1H66_13120 [Halomonas heilongjiangensis]PXX94066.1 hypothetical protein CR158_02625 [Halomonas heilongjiangensis]
MPGWLTRIGERSQRVDSLASGFAAHRPAYLVLDQRRAPERCAALVGQPGWHDFLTLFAGTPLAPLLEASPWLIELTLGSEAWQAAEALCREQRIGWAFQPAQDARLADLADHLRRLFVLDDPHGGQSLVNVQDPAAWTALLAAGSDTSYAHCIGPLGQVATPTPLHHWQAWQPAVHDGEDEAPPLTHELEHALKEVQRAWWLSQATDIPLQELPEAWLQRLGRLETEGIKQAHYLQRLLPLICQESEHFSQPVEQGLRADLPMRKRVQVLESLV